MVPGTSEENSAGIVPTTPADAAAQAWTGVQDTTSIALLEAFVKRYPDSFLADVARARIKELKQQ
jgi:hypothetical protein